MQKGELTKILHKYLLEENTPSNLGEKKSNTSDSDAAAEDILNSFNSYLYKKYNYEALNQSLFIVYKKEKSEANLNFSSLKSIEEEPANTNFNSLTPIPQEKTLNMKASKYSMIDSNKNFYANSAKQQNPSKMLSKFSMSNINTFNKICNKTDNEAISRVLTTNKCNVPFYKNYEKFIKF